MSATLFDALPEVRTPTPSILSDAMAFSTGAGSTDDPDPAAPMDDDLRGALAVRHELAAEFGEDENSIHILRPDWKLLTQHVLSLKLHVGYYRASGKLTFVDTANSEAMREDPEYANQVYEVMRLGKKLLLPEEIKVFEELEARARGEVDRVALRSDHFGYLVRKDAYFSLKERLTELQHEFFAARDSLLQRYDELKAQVLLRFRIVGRGVLAQLKSGGLDVPDDAAWIESYAQSVVDHLQPLEEVGTRFRFDWQMSLLAASSAVAEDQALAEKRRLEHQVEMEMERMRLQNIRFQEDFDYQSKQIELQRLRQERELEERIAREAAQDRLRMYSEQIEGTLKEVSTQFRELVYDACLATLKGMKKTGKVGRNNSKQLNSLVKKLRDWNVLDDADVEDMAKQMQAIVRSDSSRRNQGAIKDVLTEIGTLARSQLIAAGRTPRSGLEVNIPDVVTAERSASARRLGLAASSFELPALQRRTRRGLAPQSTLL